MGLWLLTARTHNRDSSVLSDHCYIIVTLAFYTSLCKKQTEITCLSYGTMIPELSLSSSL
jgi:hypothetical protein